MAAETQSILSQILEAINDDNMQLLRELVAELQAGELTRALESLPPGMRETLWDIIDPSYRPKILASLAEDVVDTIVEDMPLEEIISYTDEMDDDDLVDFLQGLPEKQVGPILATLDATHRKSLITMLEYDEDSAGGIMNSDIITVRPEMRVYAVIRYLRGLEELPRSTNKLFVVNRASHLLGELPLSSLVVAQRDDRVQSIMDTDFVSCNVNDEDTSVSQLFRERDLISAPVCNDAGQLVGRITIDDVVDVIQEEAEHALLSSAGLDEDTDTFAPINKAVLERGLWLGINLLTALLAASVIHAFGTTIERIVALAALSPLIASMGGIAGSQSLTIIIRGIALGQIERANARVLLMREIGISIINGIVWGGVTALIALATFGWASLAIVVFAAIFINLMLAAFMGVVIPLALKRLDIDPALAGSVILTTVTDVVGFAALLGLASLIL